MALHLYIQDAAATFTPTLQGTWNDTAHASNFGGLFNTPSGVSSTQAQAEAVATNPWDVILAGFCGATSAATIQGTVKWVFGTQRSVTTSPFATKVHIWVSVGSTNSVRGTLLNNFIGSAWSNTAQGISDGPVNLTPVVAQANDCIVVEIGYRKTGTNATSETGTLWFGSSASSPDLSGGDTNVTGHPGWIEFSMVPIWNQFTSIEQPQPERWEVVGY